VNARYQGDGWHSIDLSLSGKQSLWQGELRNHLGLVAVYFRNTFHANMSKYLILEILDGLAAID
jgi:hypothetical protein